MESNLDTFSIKYFKKHDNNFFQNSRCACIAWNVRVTISKIMVGLIYVVDCYMQSVYYIQFKKNQTLK